MKNKIIQILSDWSIPQDDKGSYEQRMLQDSDFEDVAVAILELINESDEQSTKNAKCNSK